MVTKLKKKKQTKPKINKNTGAVCFCSPLEVLKKMPAIKGVIDKELPTIDILTFDDYFSGLKEDICKYVRKGLRMNQLVMAIDKKFRAFEPEEFFTNRLSNIQRRLSIEIYTLVKNIRDRVTEKEINDLLNESKKELVNSFLIPLLYYDHKVEITVIVDDVKVIFTFKDLFRYKDYQVGSESGCMSMIHKKKELLTPLAHGERVHTAISYRVVQTKSKINNSDEPLIEAKLLFDGSPAVFGYYSI